MMNQMMNPQMMGMNPRMMGMNPQMNPQMMGMMNMNPAMGMGMMGMNPMVGGAQISQEEEELWMQGFKMGAQTTSDPEPQSPGPKMNIVFTTTQGHSQILILNYGTPIDEALKIYLKRVGKPELINDNTNKICFLFNATKIKFGDNTPVEKYFKNSPNPKIVVNDVNNLTGA